MVWGRCTLSSIDLNLRLCHFLAVWSGMGSPNPLPCCESYMWSSKVHGMWYALDKGRFRDFPYLNFYVLLIFFFLINFKVTWNYIFFWRNLENLGKYKGKQAKTHCDEKQSTFNVMISSFLYKPYKKVVLIFSNSFAAPIFIICALI